MFLFDLKQHYSNVSCKIRIQVLQGLVVLAILGFLPQSSKSNFWLFQLCWYLSRNKKSHKQSLKGPSNKLSNNQSNKLVKIAKDAKKLFDVSTNACWYLRDGVCKFGVRYDILHEQMVADWTSWPTKNIRALADEVSILIKRNKWYSKVTPKF